MKYCNCNKNWSSVIRTFALTIITLMIVCGGPVGAVADEPAANQTPSVVDKCKADLAKRLRVDAKTIEVVEEKDVTWPDASLGMPEPGKVYAQMLTPGYRVILKSGNSQYFYAASTKICKYGGPISLWAYSMLYTVPVENEANMNGDLYQCSLIGTNCTRIVSGVTDFYPQEKGVVVFTRRTSRSGVDLLYIKAGDKDPKPLYSAFYIGDTAMNSEQNKWAGLVRKGVGAGWNVVVANVVKNDENAQTLPLPDGVKPEQVAWSGESLMLLGQKGEQQVCFETSPKADKSEWKAVQCHLFPKMPDYMLNKSEHLEITQIEENGKPAVEVASVWFTGDRNVIAIISGLTMRGESLLGPYAFIWGEKDSKPAAYSVNIGTKEVIPSAGGIGRDIKPFLYSPLSSPLAAEKQ